MNKHDKETQETDSPLPEAPPSPEDREKSLDKKINDLIGPFLEEEGIEDAIVIVKDPRTGKAAVFYRGHFYDVTALMSGVYSKFKSTIAQELV
jgi:hypothetical protein